MKLCEAYQNLDNEDKDESDRLDDATFVMAQITEMTVVELAHQSRIVRKPQTEEAAAMVEALEIVAMIEALRSGALISIYNNVRPGKYGYCQIEVEPRYGPEFRKIHVCGKTLHAALTAAVASKKQEDSGNS